MTFKGAPRLAKAEDRGCSPDMRSSNAQPTMQQTNISQPVTLKIIGSPSVMRHTTVQIVGGTPPSRPWGEWLMTGKKSQNGRSE